MRKRFWKLQGNADWPETILMCSAVTVMAIAAFGFLIFKLRHAASREQAMADFKAAWEREP